MATSTNSSSTYPTANGSVAQNAGTPELTLYRALAGVVDHEAFFAQAAEHLARLFPFDALLLQMLTEEGEPLLGYQWRAGARETLSLEQQTHLLNGPFTHSALQQQTPLLLQDTREHPQWQTWVEALPVLQGLRSALVFPMFAAQGPVGVGVLARRPPHGLGQEDAQRMAAVGHALGNLLLAVRAVFAYRQQAKLSLELAQSIELLAQTLDPEEVVTRILARVQATLQAEAVLLYLYEKENQSWVLRDAIGKVLRSAIGQRYEPPASLLERLSQQKETLWLPSLAAQAQALLQVLPSVGFTPRTGYAVPIYSERQPLGVILVINPAQGGGLSFGANFLNALASVAGVSFTHARLFAQLEQAHEEYRTLFNDTLDWIIITNLQGYIVETNQTCKEMLGLRWETIRSGSQSITQIHSPDPQVLPSNLEEIPASPPLRYESQVTLPSGKTIPVEVYVRRVTVSGQPRLQWILRDISEAKQLETLREDLLSMVYHDLRSPLANILSGVDVLEAIHGREGTSGTVLDIIRRSAERIQRLTSTMLDIRRLETGQPLAKPRPTPPQQLIQEAVEAAFPLIQSKGHTIEIQEPAEPLPLVMADVGMIRRVLINLLENAAKYTPDGGHIWIGARPEAEGWVRFWVRDTGPGIPPEEQGTLFEKYTRASTSQSAQGLGLGLAYCRLAVEAHQGQIGVHSRPGEGATFYFTLPVAPSPDASPAGG